MRSMMQYFRPWGKDAPVSSMSIATLTSRLRSMVQNLSVADWMCCLFVGADARSMGASRSGRWRLAIRGPSLASLAGGVWTPRDPSRQS